jgi:hypothetical protein
MISLYGAMIDVAQYCAHKSGFYSGVMYIEEVLWRLWRVHPVDAPSEMRIEKQFG